MNGRNLIAFFLLFGITGSFSYCQSNEASHPFEDVQARVLGIDRNFSPGSHDFDQLLLKKLSIIGQRSQILETLIRLSGDLNIGVEFYAVNSHLFVRWRRPQDRKEKILTVQVRFDDQHVPIFAISSIQSIPMSEPPPSVMFKPQPQPEPPQKK